MTDLRVRTTKRADELAPGDWSTDLASPTAASKVLSVHPYTDGDDRVMVIYKDPDGLPATLHLMAHTPIDLATDDELTKLRDAAKRADRIADIRAFADWLERTPEVPVSSARMQVSLNIEGDVWHSGAEGVAEVRRLAKVMGEQPVQDDSSTQATKWFGGFEYCLISWHKDGRPAEPDTDPTGLGYSRTDDAADDPTPVSPARVPLHTGAMTERGLVDETSTGGQ